MSTLAVDACGIGLGSRRVSPVVLVGRVLDLCTRQQQQFCALTLDLALVDLTPLLDLRTFASTKRAVHARRQLDTYDAVLASRKRLLRASHEELGMVLRRLDLQRLDALEKPSAILRNHRRVSTTLFEDLNMAQTQVFTSLKVAADWLESRGLTGRSVVDDAGVVSSDGDREVLAPMLDDIFQAQQRSHDLLIEVLAVQAETLALVKQIEL